MSGPRVHPGGWRETGVLTAGFARLAGRVTGTEPPAVFRTLGRHRRLFRGWLLFAGVLMPGGRLPRRESELAILRVGATTGSEYELTQHRRLGRRAGLSAAEIERAEAVGAGLDGWRGRDRVLIATVDELLADEDLSDAAWATLRAAYDEREAIELVMLVGHYRMLATTLGVLRVRPDRPR